MDQLTGSIGSSGGSSARTFMIIIFIIGLLLVMVDVIRTYNQCPPEKTIYKYIPSSLNLSFIKSNIA